MAAILILDDSRTNQRVYARLAAHIASDTQAVLFGDPREALAWLQDHPVDLVVTDYKMPHMDGAAFTRQLRALPRHADVPVIVITAYADRRFRFEALESGATDFLLSPPDHGEFIARARNLLGMHQHHRAARSRIDVRNQELEVHNQSLQALLDQTSVALAQVIDNVPCMISAADRSGRCVFVNALQATAAGSAPEALVGNAATALFGPDHGARGIALDRAVFESGQPLAGYEEEFTGADGIHRVLLTTKTPLRDANGAVASVLTTSLDITERKLAEGRLRHMALHDPLTDLPNRTMLKEGLRRLADQGRRGQHHFALHLIDLDRFQAVNDGLGHEQGDQLLRQIADRLCDVAGGHLVAHLGGDEFAVLQDGIPRPQRDRAAAFAQRLRDAVAQPCMAGGQEVTLGASIGIALYPADGPDADALLRNADLALYRAKTTGSGQHLFSADMDRHARDRLLLESDLRAGLARQEFVLHFQPQMNLRSRRIVGVEALLRWQRPGFGLLGPHAFLPLAEDTGLIVPISAWVLRQACLQAAAWQRAGVNGLRIGINLSPLQFQHQALHELVTAALAESGLDPRCLDLELTERLLMQDPDQAAATLRQLRQLGVSVSIDDFGAGYSALNALKQFPLDRLKIDQSFIRNLKDDPSDAAIVRAIISMGHSLKLEVTAEGVETIEQLTHLIGEDCDEIQGNYLSPPLPADAMLARLLDQTFLP